MKNLAELIHRLNINEGCRLKAYQDSRGFWTVGIGLLLDVSGLATLKAVGVPDPQAVLEGRAEITQEQADAATALIVPRYVSYARESLNPGVFDDLSEARQIAWVDMAYNMGEGGLDSFTTSRQLLDEAQLDKDQGKLKLAHALFVELGQHLAQSAWDSQVHNRASRDIAMLVTGVLCLPTGSGADVY